MLFSNTQVFKTIAKLKSDAKPVADILMYVSEPGKEGYWYYDPTDSSSTENTGLVLVSGAYRFKRKLDTDLSVKKSWFTGTSEYFNSTTDINSTIVQNYRIRGMRFKVYESGLTREYWYKEGISDSDLAQINADLDIQTTLPDALSSTWDYKEGNHRKITLNNNNTSAITIINAPNNSEGVLHFIQGTGGNKTLTLPGSSPNGLKFSTNVGDRDLLRFVKDGDGQFVWEITNYGTTSTTPPVTPGATSPLTFTAIPYSSDDIISPFRGAISWHNTGDKINYPNESTTPAPMDEYRRTGIEWFRLETAQGVYAFDTVLAPYLNACITATPKRRIAFNIMSIYPGASGQPSAGGSVMAYPMYLHNLMQAESVKDYNTGSYWIPNYNSNNYLSRVEALLNAMATYFNNTTYNGVRYADAIAGMDIALVGDYGEWHHGSIQVSSLGAAFGTYTSFNRIIQAYINAFPDIPLTLMMHAMDAQLLGNVWIPKETTYFALNASNNWGKLGYSRMNWGRADADWYINDTLINNNRGINGMNFGYEISERWKYAPITGEGPYYSTSTVCGTPFCNLMNEVTTYHASSMGNGNFGGEATTLAVRNTLRDAFKKMGYRVVLEGGSLTTTLAAGSPFQISLNWKNIGIAPVYEPWTVQFILKNGSTTVWTGTSSHQLKLWLPQSTATVVTDNFTLPSNIADGTYTLAIKIIDARGYRDPFPLAINGRQSDGSYTLRSITLGTGGTAPQPKDLFLHFGESGAVGRGLNTAATGTETSVRSIVKMYNNTTNAFQDLQVGVNNQINLGGPAGEHGWELETANKVADASLQSPAYIVKGCYHSSLIAAHLNGAGTSGYGWATTTSRMDTAIAYLNSNSISYKISVVVSIGINDYNNSTTSADFKARLKQWISDFRAKYGSSIKIYLCKLLGANPANANPAGYHPFNVLYDEIAAEDTTGLTYAIDNNGLLMQDGAHLGYQGLKDQFDKVVTKMLS